MLCWTLSEKNDFQRSLEILKESLQENFVASGDTDANIINEYEIFRNFATENLEDGNPNQIQFFNKVKEWGHRILSIYYLQNFNTDNSYNKTAEVFNTEKNLVMNIADILDDLETFLDETLPNVDNDLNGNNNSRTRRKRRWQTHPINQCRAERGFYDNLVVELKEYRKCDKINIKSYNLIISFL